MLGLMDRTFFRQPPVKVDAFLQEGDEIQMDGRWQVLHTPGYTPGSISFYQPDQGILLCGDALFNQHHVTRLKGLRLPLPLVSFDDQASLASVQKITNLELGILCPGHGVPLQKDIHKKLEKLLQNKNYPGKARGTDYERKSPMKPTLNETGFGFITVDNKRVKHDILIRLDGRLEKRKKKLSKAIYGTSHTISQVEAEHVYEEGAEGLLIGGGQFGRVKLSPEAEVFFQERDCRVEIYPTPKAIQRWNEVQGDWIGLFHVTC
jgi:hypothetical protein